MADLLHQYSLHGVWDRLNPIGSHIYGHTNLTEMSLAFDLFWRNNVPANKLNSQYLSRIILSVFNGSHEQILSASSRYSKNCS